MTAEACFFQAVRINKTFGATRANKDVSLTLERGEVRGLVGENGSGKSTMVSILAGIQTKDSGEMYKEGKKYEPESPSDAYRNGIGIVVQELGLVDGLSVAANIFLGRTAQFTRSGLIDLRALYNAARNELERWRLGNIPVESMAGSLTVEERKLVELARALSIDPDILILDEITAALSHDKRQLLYGLITDLKAKGKAVIIISHDLEEVIQLTDRITIMRDGEVVDTTNSRGLTPDELKRLMVGREIRGHYYRQETKEDYDEEVVLEVRNLSVDGAFADVSFDLQRSEILGIGGLGGSGIRELGKALFGIAKPSSGSVYLRTRKVRIESPGQAIKAGIGYVPKDRDREALMLSASVEDNFCLPSTRELEARLWFLSPLRMRKLSTKAVSDYEVKTAGVTQVIGALSGGNRQKVNLGRWMLRDIDVLILDCPTRGVDVGVKAYIYGLMNEARKHGLSIIMISDELPELIGMSDRIIVMKSGRVSGIFRRAEHPTEEEIIEVMI